MPAIFNLPPLDAADEKFVQTVAGAALGTLPTLRTTAFLTRYLFGEGIQGDLVECGVFAGVHPAIMAHVAQGRKKVHLFDSFAGIPEADEHDDESITGLVGKGTGQLKSTGHSICSIEQVKKFMQQWKVDHLNLHFHKGWFQQTVPSCGIDRIALLRLDGDLYSSTQVCMAHLYDKVTPGGYIVIDDYALTGCKRAVDEALAQRKLTPEIHVVDGGMGPVWWRKQ